MPNLIRVPVHNEEVFLSIMTVSLRSGFSQGSFPPGDTAAYSGKANAKKS